MSPYMVAYMVGTLTVPRGLGHVSAEACVPEQLLHYVAAVSGSAPSLVQDCVLHIHGDNAVLVGYPLRQPLNMQQCAAAVVQVCSQPHIRRITVLAAERLSCVACAACVPQYAQVDDDMYWALDLPHPAPPQKLRNILQRAIRDVYIRQTSGARCWTAAHTALVQHTINTRPLAQGTRHIFTHIGAYLAAAPEALLWSAYNSADELVACAIGDYTSLHTAQYMFAFRSPTAPPGTADILLQHIIHEAERRGHTRCNLGLGINTHIAFFKKKWGAVPFLPYVQTIWDTRPTKISWFSRFLRAL